MPAIMNKQRHCFVCVITVDYNRGWLTCFLSVFQLCEDGRQWLFFFFQRVRLCHLTVSQNHNLESHFTEMRVEERTKTLKKALLRLDFCSSYLLSCWKSSQGALLFLICFVFITRDPLTAKRLSVSHAFLNLTLRRLDQQTCKAFGPALKSWSTTSAAVGDIIMIHTQKCFCVKGNIYIKQ